MAVAALRPVDPTFESWWVRPGSATVVELHGDDRLTVIDPEGDQPAEITVLAPDGREDPGALGISADAPATVLRAGGDDGFLAALHARGLRPHDAKALRLFGHDGAPGASQAFLAQREALVVVAAPAGRLVDGDPPASALVVEIRRAAPRPSADLELPPPLAEPRLDFRIDPASALSYEVREGEYIQVIDVKGRQCSDFLAFHRAKLERGVERGLDGVTTRTLMGNAYPSPGLQGKFYDVDMDPLVEVVRDTVGRHDTFALACTPKYYEDMGYPGHISCTENFNAQVTPYGIAERKGWEALNFFYNTGFDANNVLFFDEPWSRPGDYVLLRAMTDLVCASSACPDDIDPANGWEIMKQLVWTPPTQPSMEELKWFRFLVGRLGTYDGIPIVVSRTGYTGELGYEVFCHPDDGPAVWDAIWEAGRPHGLKPLGLEALDMIRIEAGVIFARYEVDDPVDPFEAGLGFSVR